MDSSLTTALYLAEKSRVGRVNGPLGELVLRVMAGEEFASTLIR